MGFPSSPHLPPSQKNSRRKSSFAMAILMVRWLYIRRATTTNKRAQNKPLVRHPGRGLNLGNQTNQEAHDAPWFGARGLNTGPGLAIPGGAPLWHSCYYSIRRKKCSYIYGLNDEAVKTSFIFLLDKQALYDPVRVGC